MYEIKLLPSSLISLLSLHLELATCEAGLGLLAI